MPAVLHKINLETLKADIKTIAPIEYDFQFELHGDKLHVVFPSFVDYENCLDSFGNVQQTLLQAIEGSDIRCVTFYKDRLSMGDFTVDFLKRVPFKCYDPTPEDWSDDGFVPEEDA